MRNPTGTAQSIPQPLPPHTLQPLPVSLLEQNHRAELALARLSGLSIVASALGWLSEEDALRREAVNSSQVAGSRATFTDLLDMEAGFPVSDPNDVEQVANLIRAFRLLQAALRDPTGLPFIDLLRDAHRLLLAGPAAGAAKLRQSHEDHGGAQNGACIPPPPEHVPALLTDLERFICAPPPGLPPLVRIALVHAQFATIRPFPDGNGRMGRLLVMVMLERWGLLPSPVMSLSGYLRQHQQDYQRWLAAVSAEGDWENWVSFFLDATAKAAIDAEAKIVEVSSRIAADRRTLMASGKLGTLAYRLLDLLPRMRRFTIERARQELNTTFQTATVTVTVLEQLGIVRETSGGRRNRRYSYMT